MNKLGSIIPLLYALGVSANEMIVHRTNGDRTAFPLKEISSIRFEAPGAGGDGIAIKKRGAAPKDVHLSFKEIRNIVFVPSVSTRTSDIVPESPIPMTAKTHFFPGSTQAGIRFEREASKSARPLVYDIQGKRSRLLWKKPVAAENHSQDIDWSNTWRN